MKKENRNIFIIILVVIGLIYLVGQKEDVSITDGLDEDLMNKQVKFSDVPWTIESRLSPMSEEDRISYLENVYKKKTNIGGATCSSQPDISECIESGLTITCPSSFEGDTNYGCAIQLWTAVNDDCSYDVHQTYLGETQILAGQSKTFTGQNAYFYDVYMCTDIGCLCESATNKECGYWGCDDDEMTRRRTCNPHDCGDKDGWKEHGDEWYYCASGFSECIDCDSHDFYRCYNNDIYWYDSCGGMEEKKLPDCGSVGCDYGTTVCLEEEDTCDDYNTLGYLVSSTKTDQCVASNCEIEYSKSPSFWGDKDKKAGILGALFLAWIQDMITNDPQFAKCVVSVSDGKYVMATSLTEAKEQCESGAATLVDNNWWGEDVYICKYVAPSEETCSELGGDVCSSSETCPVSFVTSSDSNRCCPTLCTGGGSVEEPDCTSNADCDSGKCLICTSGNCVSKCGAFIQTCKDGECKIGPMIYLIGIILVAMIAMKSMGGKK